MINEKAYEGVKAQILQLLDENWLDISEDGNAELKTDKMSVLDIGLKIPLYVNDKGNLAHEATLTWGVKKKKKKAEGDTKEYDLNQIPLPFDGKQDREDVVDAMYAIAQGVPLNKNGKLSGLKICKSYAREAGLKDE